MPGVPQQVTVIAYDLVMMNNNDDMIRVDGSYLCPECGLPLCGEQCEAGPWHSRECQIFSRSDSFDVSLFSLSDK